MTMNFQTQNHLDPGSTQSAWDAIAAGYDEYVTPTHIPLANEALDRIDIRPGTRFLDVAAGSGALSITAARRGAHTLGTDISPGMVEGLNENARRYGLANLAGQVMDGHDLDLDDNSFDASGSMFGVMLFADLPRGLSEMARVTKPGGTILMVTFGPPPKVEFLGFFLTAVKRVVPDFAGLPMDPPPLPFQVSDPAKLREAMSDARLDAEEVDTVTETLEFESAAHLWNWVANSNPIGAKLTGDLSPEQGESVRDTLDGMLEERTGTDRVARLTNAVNIAIGTV